MAIDQIVDVSISRSTSVPTQAGFGTAAFLSSDATISDPAEYYSLTEVTDATADVGADSVSFATAYFGQEVAPTKLVIIPDGGANITASLDAAVDKNNDWYALAAFTRVGADIAEIATWVQGHTNDNPKLYFAQTNDALVLDGTDTSDPAYVANAAAQDRTAVWYKSDTDELVGAALGKLLPTDAGSITWGLKTLSGITADTFTGAQINAAFTKKANIYQQIAGLNMTNEGTTASEWIDVMRGIDFLTSTITTNLFTYIVNEPKVPYTDASVSAVKSNILSSLTKGIEQGILQGTPSVSAPNVASVSASDKSSRNLPNVTFKAQLAGGIQKVSIAGTVTL